MLRQLLDREKHRRNPVNYHRGQGVTIGRNVAIYGGHRHTFGSEPYLVTIGDNVTISHGVDFITHDGGLRVIRDREPGAFFYAPIVVGEGVFIGAHAVLLPGAVVGERSVIGAGAVVSGEIPARVVAVGVPARPVKTIDEYAESRRTDWVDTSRMDEHAKARTLRKKFGRPSHADWAFGRMQKIADGITFERIVGED